MAQHDYVIDNASGATVRADINSALSAIQSLNSGTSEPSSTAAGMLWLDTTGGAPYALKIRDAGNNHWLTIGSVTDPGSDGNLAVSAIEGTNVLSTGESGGSKFLREDGDGSCSWQVAGKVVQVKNYQFGSVLDLGNALIPYDDTIPQNSEGGEVMTLAITPTSSTNKLKIDVLVNISAGISGEKMVVALFQDTTANALACVSEEKFDSAPILAISLSHYMTAGTSSSTTFKIRAGRTDSHSNSVTVNGTGGSRKFGGVMATSITITEILDS